MQESIITTQDSAIKHLSSELHNDLKLSSDALLGLQRTHGYWWFTLEANESIGAEFIFLMHFMDLVDEGILKGIANRILDVQRQDGTWALYHDGPADLSTTVECYIALRLAGLNTDHPALEKARSYIIELGGAENTRVFTLIHLAMFGFIPWSACPEMPAELIWFPTWQLFNIYEFSSWARATIVPLIAIGTIKPVKQLNINIDELFRNPVKTRAYKKQTYKKFFSYENLFIKSDALLKIYSRITPRIMRKPSINKCLSWIKQHINCTEDIYPALAYGAMAFKAAGYPTDSPEIKKPIGALKMFQQGYLGQKLPAMPLELPDDGKAVLSKLRDAGILKCEPSVGGSIHQQCCISPVWDTPWAALALLEAGVSPSHPSLIKTGNWLISKQITKAKGDWAVKNNKGEPGGWSFEFENDFFPDVDDTIAAATVLHMLDLPKAKKDASIERAVKWIMSMQNDDGGFGAFDKNNCKEWVNRIPFSDHKACLDPSTPDITARILELLCILEMKDSKAAMRALSYLIHTQEKFGGWYGRWGIDYIYGTWCAATALSTYGWSNSHDSLKKAAKWLISVQNPDGGFGESPESYVRKEFVPNSSCPSQTAWGLMGLVALGLANSNAAKSAVSYLLKNRGEDFLWEEPNYTGTGFEGHFYIRYHGYARFFPLLALARWQKAINAPVAHRSHNES